MQANSHMYTQSVIQTHAQRNRPAHDHTHFLLYLALYVCVFVSVWGQEESGPDCSWPFKGLDQYIAQEHLQVTHTHTHTHTHLHNRLTFPVHITKKSSASKRAFIFFDFLICLSSTLNNAFHSEMLHVHFAIAFWPKVMFFSNDSGRNRWI